MHITEQINFNQFYKRYVLVTFKDEGKIRTWEGCLYEISEEFIFVAGAFSIPIRKDSIQDIEITRE